ncbi:hypothetical protein PVAP13_6KG022101 [Panicum virgatum]|uniref:Uncharacterized protein n=1 Tax=Panicum virgatum TaxID=38727 RepID=A0A8T0R8L7_PANVG|nr:hypothetical protein PVAP13_6KG022101 [Panicum virgatum]
METTRSSHAVTGSGLAGVGSGPGGKRRRPGHGNYRMSARCRRIRPRRPRILASTRKRKPPPGCGRTGSGGGGRARRRDGQRTGRSWPSSAPSAACRGSPLPHAAPPAAVAAPAARFPTGRGRDPRLRASLRAAVAPRSGTYYRRPRYHPPLHATPPDLGPPTPDRDTPSPDLTAPPLVPLTVLGSTYGGGET